MMKERLRGVPYVVEHHSFYAGYSKTTIGFSFETHQIITPYVVVYNAEIMFELYEENHFN